MQYVSQVGHKPPRPPWQVGAEDQDEYLIVNTESYYVDFMTLLIESQIL